MPALGDDIHGEERAAQLEATCRRLQRQLADAQAKTADLVGAVYRGAYDAALVNGVAGPVPAPKKDRRKPQGETALLHLTDTHVGAKTESYNTEVAYRRIRETVAKAIRLTEIQRADHPVRDCVLLLGGDLIEQTGQFPNMVWLYRRPILDYWAEHEETLGHIVRHVLIHEIGHHFGLSDDDIARLESD